MGQEHEYPDPSEGWRLLGDEVIIAGDEMQNPFPRDGESGDWVPVYEHATGRQAGHIMRYFRRRLPSATSEVQQ